MDRPQFNRHTYPALALLTASTVVLGLSPAAANVLLSDDFNRTAGSAPEGGPYASDWGTNNNGSGGALSGSYVGVAGADEFGVDYVAEGRGVMQFSRAIHDVNLATQAAIDAGGIIIQYDLNPGDALFGRDWGGLGLSDTNSTAAIGGSAALFNNNADLRLSVLPRNSGTAVTKRFDSGGNYVGVAGGIPGSLTEAIFDQETWDDYVEARTINGGDTNLVFERDLWYTVRIVISETETGNLFASGAVNNFEVLIGRQGETLTPFAFDPNNPFVDEFTWGDNQKTAGGVAPNDPVSATGRYAFAVFGGNGNFHQFDNYSVSLIPEPGSLALLGLGGLLMGMRRRKTV